MPEVIQVGFRRGNLTVTSAAGTSKQGHRQWGCLCECGNSVVLRSAHLKDEKRAHCGHQCSLLRKKRLKVDVGARFGRWIVLKDSGNDATGNATFECKCDCGTIKPRVLAFILLNGETKSCGCLSRELATKHGKYKTVEYRRQVANKYARNNPAKMRAGKLRYQAALALSTPRWLTEAHWEEMNSLYLKARQMSKDSGISMHVDHILPIRGKAVSGLHVPWNLQILPASENISKSNEIV
jgi:hypothetical protein